MLFGSVILDTTLLQWVSEYADTSLYYFRQCGIVFKQRLYRIDYAVACSVTHACSWKFWKQKMYQRKLKVVQLWICGLDVQRETGGQRERSSDRRRRVSRQAADERPGRALCGCTAPQLGCIRRGAEHAHWHAHRLSRDRRHFRFQNRQKAALDDHGAQPPEQG